MRIRYLGVGYNFKDSVRDHWGGQLKEGREQTMQVSAGRVWKVFHVQGEHA